MDWDLMTWGLLMGIAGMLWMMVLAVTTQDRDTHHQTHRTAKPPDE